MTSALAAYQAGWRAGFARERTLTVSQWADEYRVLSRLTTAEHGKWRTRRTPYLREIMDALSPQHPAEIVVFMKGSQIGGTECGNNWIGYVIHRDPGPMLIVWPTGQVADTNSKQRVAPLIADTPVLRERVSEARSRDSNNTVHAKSFEGGILIIRGANSAAGLESMPIRYLFMDEVDRYPRDVAGHGDPLALALKRTDTFSQRKIFMVSTPDTKGESRIEEHFLLSDQRRYFVPCPKCGNYDWIRWENIRWDPGDVTTARLACLECGALIEERHKATMLERGEWRPTAVARRPGTVGFHLPAFYSPLGWKSWAECAAEFEEAKNDPPKLKVWVNTVPGETWEERGEAADPDTLRARSLKETLERRRVPHGAGVLVMSVDVQSDRLELLINAYGAGEESWLIDYEVIYGDPEQPNVWYQLDKYIAAPLEHVGGRLLYPERILVDSGGLSTDEVYRYCKTRLRRRHTGWEILTFPIKGGVTTGRPLVEKPTRTNRYRVPLFVLCVDSGKSMVVSRLRVSTAGPGYMHLGAWIDDEFLAQLTAEKAVKVYQRGRGWTREWKKIRTRNEALDLEVYALAALYVMGTDFIRRLPERAKRWSSPPDPPPPGSGPAPAAAPQRRRPRMRGGWLDQWRT